MGHCNATFVALGGFMGLGVLPFGLDFLGCCAASGLGVLSLWIALHLPINLYMLPIFWVAVQLPVLGC